MVEVTAPLRELTARLIRAEDLQQALDVLAGTALAAVPGAVWCGVTVLRDGHPATLATAGAAPHALLGAASGTEEGPCLEAIRTRALTACADVASERRWPRWTPIARDLGVRGVMSVPLDVNDTVVGALTLYGARPKSLDDRAQLTAMLVAEHAGLLLGSVLERTDRAERTARLVEDLREGAAVDHAVGIVMAQRRCTADEALAVLRGAAEALDVRPRVVAERLIAAVRAAPTSGGTDG